MSTPKSGSRAVRARTYRMVRRADNVDETRRRIVEAAVRLHTTVGPAATTIAGIADEAAVTRLTVYRHFPDLEPLFTACRAHWRDTHPPPDPARWATEADLRQRALLGLAELYAWYRANAADLTPIYRDMAASPASSQKEVSDNDDHLARVLVGEAPGAPEGSDRRRLYAAARHLVRFETWASLASDGGLDDEEAVELGAALLLLATGLQPAT